MTKKELQEAQNPLILRCHRLMEAFAKADDERDFYLDRHEGFILLVDLDKSDEELNQLFVELEKQSERYCPIPKLTFYETKKIMEGFVNEKVYDIDTKEKLLDIIQSKDARENFLEFLYDLHSEFEKWQQFYQERSRIRIIEWLRNNHFHFVFEEDLDMAKSLLEKVKLNLFQAKVGKDILAARKSLFAKAKTYYSNEALNPRPKRGRPPKQAAKQESEPQLTSDIFLSVTSSTRPFLFIPEHGLSTAFTFSSKFESEEEMLASRRAQTGEKSIDIDAFNTKLASLRALSAHWLKSDADSPTAHEEWDDEEINDKKPSKKEKAKPSSTNTNHVEQKAKKGAISKSPPKGQKEPAVKKAPPTKSVAKKKNK